MSFHSDIKAGILSKASLDTYLESHQIDEISTEKGNGTLGFTPLALAARHGNVELVKLLLENGAGVDAPCNPSRTALWIITQGQGDNRAEITDLLLSYGASAKYVSPSDPDGLTPLENELRQLADPVVVRLLIKYGGMTDGARKLAQELDNPDINEVINSIEEHRNPRRIIVGLITSLITLILAWANSAVFTAGAIYNKFRIRGNTDSPMAKSITAEIPVPKTKEEFTQGIDDFVKKHKLDKFFPKSDTPLLSAIVEKALAVQNDTDSALGSVASAEDLIKFALYQPIIYCDDSGSMRPSKDGRENRWEDQKELVRRIAAICTQVVPEDLGVHLRFINSQPSNADNLREADIEEVISRANPKGFTEIGTHLRKRILEPLVYNQTMERPLFISIITDGIPGGSKSSTETRRTLQDEIVGCQDYLLENGLPPRAVVFQISQIGTDPDAKAFLQALKESSLSNVYVTAEQLDAKFDEFRANDRGLEAWLFQTLLTPILGSDSD